MPGVRGSVRRSGRRVRVTVTGLLGVLLLTACGGGDGTAAGDEGDGTAASPSTGDVTAEATTAGDYLPVPDELSLTAPGTELDHGQSATVAWELAGGEVAVADLQVERVRRVRRSVFAGWLQEGALESTAPYFVDVVVENRGTTDLGGGTVPLYLLDASGTLRPPAAFGGRFEPCSSRPLPRRFGRGDEAERCLVHLAPRRGGIEGVAFVPAEGFDAITWRGRVRGPGRPDKPNKQDKQDKQDKHDTQ